SLVLQSSYSRPSSCSCSFFHMSAALRCLHSFPTRRSSDLVAALRLVGNLSRGWMPMIGALRNGCGGNWNFLSAILSSKNSNCRRSEEHTSELQSRENLVCRLLLEKKKKCTRTVSHYECI